LNESVDSQKQQKIQGIPALHLVLVTPRPSMAMIRSEILRRNNSSSPLYQSTYKLNSIRMQLDLTIYRKTKRLICRLTYVMALILQILVPIHRRSVGLWSGTPFEPWQRTRANGIIDWQRLARTKLRRHTFIPWGHFIIKIDRTQLIISWKFQFI